MPEWTSRPYKTRAHRIAESGNAGFRSRGLPRQPRLDAAGAAARRGGVRGAGPGRGAARRTPPLGRGRRAGRRSGDRGVGRFLPSRRRVRGPEDRRRREEGGFPRRRRSAVLPGGRLLGGLQDHLPDRSSVGRSDLGALPGLGGCAVGRVLRVAALRRGRDDVPGIRQRSGHHLHRSRDDGPRELCAGRIQQGKSKEQRGGAEVLHPRRPGLGGSTVRLFPDLRSHGFVQSRRHRGVDRRRDGRARRDAQPRGGPGPGRHGVQDRRRAVPHVGTRRLRGRTDAGDRVHLHGGQGRSLRDAVASLPARFLRTGRRLGLRCWWCCPWRR